MSTDPRQAPKIFGLFPILGFHSLSAMTRKSYSGLRRKPLCVRNSSAHRPPSPLSSCPWCLSRASAASDLPLLPLWRAMHSVRYLPPRTRGRNLSLGPQQFQRPIRRDFNVLARMSTDTQQALKASQFCSLFLVAGPFPLRLPRAVQARGGRRFGCVTPPRSGRAFSPATLLAFFPDSWSAAVLKGYTAPEFSRAANTY